VQRDKSETHSGKNSGRNVNMEKSRAVGSRSKNNVRTSSVEGSTQCKSSQAQYIAAFSASSIIHATNAFCVFCFCFCGLNVNGGIPSGCGRESKAASNGAVSAWGK